MKRLFSGILALALALAFIVPASIPAFADSKDKDEVKMPPAFRAALTIKSPNTAQVSQSVTVTVFGKRNRETIAGASVFALKAGDLDTKADSDNYTKLISQYEALAAARGKLLGVTGDNGTLTATFSDAGRFLLVATFKGYAPGFSRINIWASVGKQLSLKAPQSAPVGQQVTITAIERSTGQPVDNATVYAFKPNIKLPPTIKQAPAPVENGTATAVLIDSSFADAINADEARTLLSQSIHQSILIGTTDAGGQVLYTFGQQGAYTLVVFKDGYLPGGKRINIVSTQVTKALEINAPVSATTGQSVYLNVWERGSRQPVAGASIYIRRIGDVPVPKPLLPVTTNQPVTGMIRAGEAVKAKPWINENDTEDVRVKTNTGIKLMPPTANNDKAKSDNFNIIEGARVLPWAVINPQTVMYDAGSVKENGQLIGVTGDNGQLVYTFSSPGRYALAAFKDGYNSSVALINVGGTTPTDNTTQ